MQYGGFAPPPQPSGQFNYGGGQYGMPPPPYSETQPPAATSGYNVPVCLGPGEGKGKVAIILCSDCPGGVITGAIKIQFLLLSQWKIEPIPLVLFP